MVSVFLLLAGCTAPGSTTSTTTTAPPPIAATTTAPPPWQISVEDAHALIAQNRDNPDFVILDVRTPGEYADSHIENSVLIDFQSPDFQDRIAEMDRDRTYLVYCRSGVRSAAASNLMVGLGFKYVYNMTGGITDWQAAGFPVAR